MSARAFAVFMAVLAVIALLAFGLVNKDSDPAIAVGKPLPDAELPRLGGGGSASLADYRGRWVLVNYWASWCDPCRAEAPALERFYRRHRRDGFTIVGVDTQDNSEDGLAFARQYHVSYPLLHDGSGEQFDALGMRGVPESVLLNPQGEVALYQPGPFASSGSQSVEALVGPLIEGGHG